MFSVLKFRIRVPKVCVCVCFLVTELMNDHFLLIAALSFLKFFHCQPTTDKTRGIHSSCANCVSYMYQKHYCGFCSCYSSWENFHYLEIDDKPNLMRKRIFAALFEGSLGPTYDLGPETEKTVGCDRANCISIRQLNELCIAEMKPYTLRRFSPTWYSFSAFVIYQNI